MTYKGNLTWENKQGKTAKLDGVILVGFNGAPYKKTPGIFRQLVMECVTDSPRWYDDLKKLDGCKNAHPVWFSELVAMMTSENWGEALERVIKVWIANNLEKLYNENFESVARRLYFLLARHDNDFEEKTIIDYLNDGGRICYDYFANVRHIKEWRIKQIIKHYLPQGVEYPQEEIKFITSLATKYPFAAKELASALRSGLVHSMLTVQQNMNDSNCMYMIINNYLRLCEHFEEAPKLSGNIIAKYAAMLEAQEAKKDEAFARKQTEKPLTFSAYGYTVIVPTTKRELIEEGNAQSNCVGRWGYYNQVIDGKCFIVFVRKETAPTKAFVTCEIISRTGRINQFLGHGNNAPQGESLEAFKEAYAAYLHKLFLS